MVTGLFGAAYAAEPETLTINEMITANETLAQGDVTEESYIIKSISGSTVMTVVAAGPDLMFVQDASTNAFLAVERAEGGAPFNSVYHEGSKIPKLEVHYKSNYVTRNGSERAIPYSVFVGDTYPVDEGTATLNYNAMYSVSQHLSSYQYARVQMGQNYSQGSKQLATWNDETGTFDIQFTYSGTTYTTHVYVREMGVDTSDLIPGEYYICVEGIMQPMPVGYAIYPNKAVQYHPVDVEDIAGVYALQSVIPSGKTSFNIFNLKSKVKITAVGDSKIYIEDESGAMGVQTVTSSVKFTNFDIEAGDEVQGLSFYVYYINNGDVQIYGKYESTTFPTPVGFSEVTFPLVTSETLKENRAEYDCRPVMMENVQVNSSGKFGTLSINQSTFMSGFQFDPHKYYTIKGIYEALNSGSVQTITAVETGDIPPLVPIEVANLTEFKEKGEDLEYNATSADIYKITGKVGILHKAGGSYLIIQDGDVAMQVKTNSTSSFTTDCKYVNGNVVENLVLRLQNFGGEIMGFFDRDECSWPAVVQGESFLPQIVDKADITPADEYKWVRVRVTTSSTSAFRIEGLYTTGIPNGPVNVTFTNNNLMSSRPSAKSNTDYIFTGAFVGSHSGDSYSAWNFYATAYEIAPDAVINDVDDIAALKTAVATLGEGETTAVRYRLGPIYVTVRTPETIFAQTATDGIKIISNTAGSNLYGFAYNYGDVVNGMTGYVKKMNGELQLLVDPMAYNPSTMNMSFLVQTQDIEIEDIDEYPYVMVNVKAECLTPAASETTALYAASNAFTIGSLNLIIGEVIDSEMDDVEINEHDEFNFKGVSDGENFYPYSAEYIGNTGIEEVKETVAVTDIYTIDGKRVNSISNGIYIIRTSDGKSHKICRNK